MLCTCFNTSLIASTQLIANTQKIVDTQHQYIRRADRVGWNCSELHVYTQPH